MQFYEYRASFGLLLCILYGRHLFFFLCCARSHYKFNAIYAWPADVVRMLSPTNHKKNYKKIIWNDMTRLPALLPIARQAEHRWISISNSVLGAQGICAIGHGRCSQHICMVFLFYGDSRVYVYICECGWVRCPSVLPLKWSFTNRCT